MGAEQDLIQKLMISKKIMEKSDTIKRGDAQPSMDSMSSMNSHPAAEKVAEFSVPNATYNLPQEYLQESKPIKQFNNTQDKILNSKLPEAIKKLMIEHPIDQPKQMAPTISDEIVEKAVRLMNTNKEIVETVHSKTPTVSTKTPKNDDLKQMLKEVVKEVLAENGLLSESSQKTKETVSIRVGDHIFEGQIHKVKKVKKV